MTNLDIRLLADRRVRSLQALTIDPRQSAADNQMFPMTPEALARFAKVVTEGRRKAETRTAFAETLGITRATLRAWERGQQHPTPENLERLAAVLGVTVREIMGEAPILPDDERLRDLVDEDLAIARAYHHAPAAVKLALQELATAPVSHIMRDRIGHLVSLLMRYQDPLVSSLEDIALPLDSERRTLPHKLVRPATPTERHKKR